MSKIDDARRLDHIVKLLNKYDLNPEHVDLLRDKEINPSCDAPYHNAQHLFTVALHAERLSCYYSSAAISTNGKMLLLAGLYHDINHSTGKYGDAVNVARAASDMVSLMELVEPTLTPATLNEIADLILATEHPSKLTSAETMTHRIIQDADLLYALEPDFEEMLAGLAEETGMVVNVASSRHFFEHHQWRTQKAREDMFRKGWVTRAW